MALLGVGEKKSGRDNFGTFGVVAPDGRGWNEMLLYLFWLGWIKHPRLRENGCYFG